MFCYLGDRLNFNVGCEAAVTAKERIGWVRFSECGNFLLGKKVPLRMKGKVYRCCVRSAMGLMHGSEAWCLKENEKATLKRTERTMVRAMCAQKVVDGKTTEEQMDIVGLKETINRLTTANGVRWCGQVLKRDDNSVLRGALDLEGVTKESEDDQRRPGRSKWRRKQRRLV